MEKGEQIVESYEHNSSPIEISRHAKNVCNVEAPESIMSMVTHTTENNSLFRCATRFASSLTLPSFLCLLDRISYSELPETSRR